MLVHFLLAPCNKETFSCSVESTPWIDSGSQLHKMRTPLYTVEPLYSSPLKLGHLCIQSIPTPEMRTSLYTVESLYSNP